MGEGGEVGRGGGVVWLGSGGRMDRDRGDGCMSGRVGRGGRAGWVVLCRW